MHNTDTISEELRRVCRQELHTYPTKNQLDLKQKLKASAKALAISVYTRRIQRADKFFWPNGLLATALELSHKRYNDHKDLEALIAYYNNWIKSGTNLNHLNNIINAYSLIYILEKTESSIYEKILHDVASYIENYPRDQYGSLPYKKHNNENIYLDSMGMICPFLCRWGKLTKQNKYTDLAILQLLNFFKYGFDEEKFLPYHGYNTNEDLKLGIIGWGRGVGWLMIGLSDSLEYINKNHSDYSILTQMLNKLTPIIINYQNNKGYFSWQLEASEGHIDTSATAMIGYAIRKAVEIEVLDKKYLANSESALEALISSTNNGIVGDCSDECRGLGMYPQRYASYPWSQGPTTALYAISVQ